jgi:hypothetical protein
MAETCEDMEDDGESTSDGGSSCVGEFLIFVHCFSPFQSLVQSRAFHTSSYAVEVCISLPGLIFLEHSWKIKSLLVHYVDSDVHGHHRQTPEFGCLDDSHNGICPARLDPRHSYGDWLVHSYVYTLHKWQNSTLSTHDPRRILANHATARRLQCRDLHLPILLASSVVLTKQMSLILGGVNMII